VPGALKLIIIHQVSELTHAHKRSLIACGIYISVASMILESGSLQTGIELGVSKALDYYQHHDAFAEEHQPGYLRCLYKICKFTNYHQCQW